MKSSARIYLLLLICAVVLSRLLAIHQTDMTSVYTTPLVDDSYYYFALGEHLAQGIGIKVDRLHFTTGFQPLWGFLLAIPYRIFPNDLTNPITAIQLLGMLVSVISTILIFTMSSQLISEKVAAVVTGLIMLSPYSISTSINGMETGLSIMMTIAVFFCLSQIYQKPQRSRFVLTGVVCGAAFLARVDTAFLTASVLVILWWIPPQSPKRVLPVFTVALCALIPISPWALIAISMGKSPIPESGEAVRLLALLLRGTNPIPIPPSSLSVLSPETWTILGQKFIQFLAEFANRVDFTALRYLLPTNGMGQLAIFLTVFVITLVFSVPIMLSTRKPQMRPLIWVFALYLGAMFVVYPTLVQSDWFFNRYVAPISALFTLFSALYIFREQGSGWKKTARIAFLVSCLIAYTLILFNDDAYKWILYGSQARQSESHYDTAQWINANIPSGNLIGGFQTGLIGYYSIPTVINLDGKVNSDAREALKNAQMGNYLCSNGVQYVVDQPMIIQHLLIERTENWDTNALKLLYTGVGEPDNPMQVYRFNCAALKQTESTQ